MSLVGKEIFITNRWFARKYDDAVELSRLASKAAEGKALVKETGPWLGSSELATLGSAFVTINESSINQKPFEGYKRKPSTKEERLKRLGTRADVGREHCEAIGPPLTSNEWELLGAAIANFHLE